MLINDIKISVSLIQFKHTIFTFSWYPSYSSYVTSPLITKFMVSSSLTIIVTYMQMNNHINTVCWVFLVLPTYFTSRASDLILDSQSGCSFLRKTYCPCSSSSNGVSSCDFPHLCKNVNCFWNYSGLKQPCWWNLMGIVSLSLIESKTVLRLWASLYLVLLDNSSDCCP